MPSCLPGEGDTLDYFSVPLDSREGLVVSVPLCTSQFLKPALRRGLLAPLLPKSHPLAQPIRPSFLT